MLKKNFFLLILLILEDTGLPYHIIVSELSINGIEAAYDSEIAIFDGELCVGVGQYDPNNTIVVWGGDDNQSLQGFIQGNPIDIYVYHYLFNQWVLSSSDIDVIQGDGTFGNNSYSVLTLSITTENFPVISSNKSAMNFNNIELNSVRDDSLYVYNNGDAILEITSIYSTNSRFNINGTTGLIQPQDSLKVIVSFLPNEAQFETGMLEILSDDPETPVLQIELQGQGIPISQPIILCNGNLNFGSVPIGSSVSEHLQIQNTGNEELLISGFSLNDESIPFSISEENIIIAPGESYFLPITFSNFEEGYYYGQLVIESNSFGFDASTYINLEALGYHSYFDSVNPTGLPYSIIINDVTIDNHGLQNGDEIGFFDTDATGEEICVGSFRYSNQDYPIQTVVWRLILILI